MVVREGGGVCVMKQGREDRAREKKQKYQHRALLAKVIAETDLTSRKAVCMYICRTLVDDREVAYQRAGTARGRGGDGEGGGVGRGDDGAWALDLGLDLETGAGWRSWALGGLVAADTVDKRASERGSPASILNLSRLVAV